MKKMLITGFIGIVLIAALMVWLISKFASSIENESQQYKNKIGNKIILEKDTLTIIDYSLFNQTFTLSNGKTVNKSFILP